MAHSEISVSTSTDAIINVPIATTWQLFTTASGLADMGYKNPSVSLMLNARIHGEREIERGVDSIDGTITSFDPQHMLSWRWSTDSQCWSVLYLNAMGNEMTQIRWLDFCATSTSIDLNVQSKMHRDLFDKLIRRYAPECHVCKEERAAAGSH